VVLVANKKKPKLNRLKLNVVKESAERVKVVKVNLKAPKKMLNLKAKKLLTRKLKAKNPNVEKESVEASFLRLMKLSGLSRQLILIGIIAN
jgi:hypothetical protein